MASKRSRPGASGASSGRDARAKRRPRPPAPRRSRSSFSASREWAVYQLLDPLLPTGGFAHSQGLEAAARSGLVAGGDERPSALAAKSSRSTLTVPCTPRSMGRSAVRALTTA